MKKLINGVLLTGSLMLLGGCSSFFAIDEQKFACEQAEAKGMTCLSVRAAFAASDNYDPDAQIVMAEPGKKKRRSKQHQEITPFSNAPITDVVADTTPKPLLLPTEVMSVWVNNYEDAQGNLVYPTRIYSEIQTRKWDTGYKVSSSESRKSRRVTPLISNQQNLMPAVEQQAASEASQDNATDRNRDSATQNKERQPIPDSLPAGLLPPLK